MIGKRLLPILFLLLVACSTKSGQRAAGDDLFGNVQESTQVTEEITFVEPDGDDGDATTVDGEGGDAAETLPCDQISILSQELPEAMAGEEYRFPFSIQNNCQQVECSLETDAGSEWVGLNGCELNGIPASHEALGQHELRLRVFGHDHETTFEERAFTLIVRDEPSIALFTAHPKIAEAMKKEIGGANSKEENVYSITLDRHALYARVQGYADSYTILPLNSKLLTLEDLGNKLYRVLPVENILAPNQDELLISDLNISAEDEFGNSVEKTFDLHIFRNPCDHPLTITPLGTWTDTDYADLEEDQVVLGSKYQVLFQVTGGEATDQRPYVWEVVNRTIASSEEGDDSTQHDGWWSITSGSDTDEINDDTAGNDTGKRYYQLETIFRYDSVEFLPYPSITEQIGEERVQHRADYFWDQVEVRVSSPICEEERGPSFLPETREHQLRVELPPETVADIQCSQDVTLAYDTNRNSMMGIVFETQDHAVGFIEYNVYDCRGDGDISLCRNPKQASLADPFPGGVSISPADITTIVLAFTDYSERDNWCIDCDHDQLDYHLESISCETNYRQFSFIDMDNQIHCQVTPTEPDTGWHCGWGADCAYGDPSGRMYDNPNCLGSAINNSPYLNESHRVCLVGGNEYHFVNTGSQYFTRNFEFPIRWQPRLRPDYSDSN